MDDGRGDAVGLVKRIDSDAAPCISPEGIVSLNREKDWLLNETDTVEGSTNSPAGVPVGPRVGTGDMSGVGALGALLSQ